MTVENLLMSVENLLLTGDSDEAVALAAAFGLPVKNLKSFTFTVTAGEVASLTAVYYVNEGTASGIAGVLDKMVMKRYRLLEMTDIP